MDEVLIAPCGINCNICPGHLRKNKRCPGCNRDDGRKLRCVIRNCETIKTNWSGFCYECKKFPCRRIRQIDERYRTNRGISNIENLGIIKEKGVACLIQKEEERWKCPECGMVMGHNGICYACGYGKPKKMERKRFVGEVTDEVLIAPCGMNCGICSGYLAMKYDVKSQGLKMGSCSGCRPRGKNCGFLIQRCELLGNNQVQYCYECSDFPCLRLKSIDKRYRERYHMSMIENLTYLKEYGMKKFLEREEEKWRCPDCGGTICCHNGICFSCGVEKLKAKKNKHRWTDD
jgi:hypothetical protein